MPKAIEIDPVELGKLAELHCTIEEAATFFGCSPRTVLRYLDSKHRDARYREAWERGRAMGRISLRRLQWRHAEGTGMAAVNMTIHMSKFVLGETEAALARRAADPDAPELPAGRPHTGGLALKQRRPDGTEGPYEGPGSVVPFPTPDND